MKVSFYRDLVVNTIKEWQEDQAASLAAALAYYTTFSLAPLLVLVIAIAGLLGGREAAHGLIMNQVQELVGLQGRQFVGSMIERASSSLGVTASILGTITLLIAALGVFNELQKALNRIWDVEPKPIEGWDKRVMNFVVKRLLSFSMLVVIGFLLLVALVVSAGLAAIQELVSGIPVLSNVMLQVLNFIISLGLITLLFALIFKFIPDVKISWRNVWLGAAITAVLFTIGKLLIGLYLGKSNVGTTFGAAGSLALVMIWVYYSAQILFLGAEFTQVHARKIGGHPSATKHAIKIDQKRQPSLEGLQNSYPDKNRKPGEST